MESEEYQALYADKISAVLILVLMEYGI